jgi:hypothetical protein
MDMTAGQRKAVFAVIVLVLAGLGIYLVVPGARGASPSASSHSPPARPAATSRSATPGAPVSPSSAPAAAGPDIYQWLPFSQSELATAAGVVTQFCVDYGTWSYTQDASAYVGAIGTLMTPELSQVLAQGYSVPGVASLRASQKQVSTATATINSLRAFGPSSMTFVVTILQRITGTGGTSPQSTQYAVTVAGSGSSWQVNDIELATAGNS